MKKSILIVAVCLLSLTAFAKKVKFAVDMTGVTIATTGVHMMGDFQSIAGLGADWTPTPMYQEGASDIYSLIVDIPAFAKYEYRYLSGDQTYEAEFVPVESRVGYDFIDNRWMFLDSIANDTTYIGAMVFGGNAPLGLTLVRFAVDLQNETVSTNRPHVAGDFQGWNTNATSLYKFDQGIYYENNVYIPNGTYEFKYYNGTGMGDAEIVPAGCNVNGNRQMQVTADVVLSTVCFSFCTDCNAIGLNKNTSVEQLKLYPNPTEKNATLVLEHQNVNYIITVTDQLGRKVKSVEHYNNQAFGLDGSELGKGLYFVTAMNTKSSETNTTILMIK